MTDPAARTRVLVAEDDRSLRNLLAEILRDAGYAVVTVDNGLDAVSAATSGDFALVLSDVRMPGCDGTAVVRAVSAMADPPPVVLLTAFATVPGAVEAMRAGAFDYVTKPIESPQALRDLVARALQSRGGAKSAPSRAGSDAVFSDPASAQVLRVIELVSARDTTVLLLGESGVGKEVCARQIHAASHRRGAPFIAVNCGAIPAQLFESQLFGHARGAFTGAHAAHRGVFEEAQGGTVLLDEVGELPLDAQVKLLRALESRRITRVGEAQEREVDVRVLAATHRDLEADVRQGRFREDLYYRLSVFPLRIPPLRERRGDILPLARVFLRQLGEPDLVLTDDAAAWLAAQPWPGNARELRNAIERAVILSGGGPVRREHLAPATAPAPAHAPADTTTLVELERQAILDALEATDGNRRQAAERLGIALRTLQYKLKEYGLTRR
jgi:DNA-binding NtrC family response regulator